MRWLSILLLISILLLPGSQALKMFSDDYVTIDTPIEDDIIIAGSYVKINAPVDSVVIAGGDVEINAPVGSAVIAGGTVEIDAPIKGDLFVIGGQIYVNSDVGGKVMATGGTMNIKGHVARNLVLAGGDVKIRSNSEIDRDALITANDLYNAGTIKGTLTVSAEDFENTGSAGKLNVIKTKKPVRDEKTGIEQVRDSLNIFKIVILVGFLIVGLIIVGLFPKGALAIDQEIKDSPVIKTVVGFVFMVALVIFIFIAAISVIGLPLALTLGLLSIVTLMLSNLFVSFSLGKQIATITKLGMSNMLAFVVGYAILNALFIIPYAGGLIELISISLGFGAVVYALQRNRQTQQII